MKLKMNRLLLAGLCTLCAIILCFGVTPLFNRALQQEVEIMRVTARVPKGSRLEAGQVERVTVGGYNLPAGVISAETDCLGKYLMGDVVPGDYLLPEKLSDSPLLGNEYLMALEDKLAFSVTLKSFAAGLSAKLEPLDIVTVFYTDNASNPVQEALLPPDLQYVKVLAVTNADAVDIDAIQTANTTIAESEESESILPATVTLLVTPHQAQLLAAIEAGGKIQLALTCRGAKEKARAQELLALQETISANSSQEDPQTEDAPDANSVAGNMEEIPPESSEPPVQEAIVEDADE